MDGLEWKVYTITTFVTGFGYGYGVPLPSTRRRSGRCYVRM